MKKVFLLFLMSSALSALATEPAAATKIFLDAESDGADPKIVVTEWYILPEHLQKLPSYQPAVDSPPLSVKEALGLAQDELKKHLVAQETWSLDSVELQQIDAGNSGEISQESFVDKPTGKWFYKVIFTTQRPDPKTSTWTAPYPVYVLMDGTVATRRERPQTKEEKAENEQFGQGVRDAVLKDAGKAK